MGCSLLYHRQRKDFNDLHLTEGLQSARRQLEIALPDKPLSLVSLDMDEFLSMSGYLLEHF